MGRNIYSHESICMLRNFLAGLQGCEKYKGYNINTAICIIDQKKYEHTLVAVNEHGSRGILF